MGQMRRDELVKQYTRNAGNAARIRELEQQLSAANARIAFQDAFEVAVARDAMVWYRKVQHCEPIINRAIEIEQKEEKRIKRSLQGKLLAEIKEKDVRIATLDEENDLYRKHIAELERLMTENIEADHKFPFVHTTTPWRFEGLWKFLKGEPPARYRSEPPARYRSEGERIENEEMDDPPLDPEKPVLHVQTITKQQLAERVGWVASKVADIVEKAVQKKPAPITPTLPTPPMRVSSVTRDPAVRTTDTLVSGDGKAGDQLCTKCGGTGRVWYGPDSDHGHEGQCGPCKGTGKRRSG